MKALTIHQPYAWLITHGHKRVENRTWLTEYRGPLAIHAGRRLGAERKGWLDPGQLDLLREAGIPVPDVDELVYGAIIGVVDLVDAVRFNPRGRGQRTLLDPHDLANDPFATGPCCLILENPRPLAEPIPCPGRQQLWDCPVPVKTPAPDK